jgi:hypothetical protein
LPAEEALRYAIDIGSALNRAHKRGAVHGKLSPHAILLTESGARIVRPVEGTDLDALAYRSPEQVSGEAPDWRSDIFSFGTLLYEMVSGRRAFSGEGAALDRAILEGRRHLDGQVADPCGHGRRDRRMHGEGSRAAAAAGAERGHRTAAGGAARCRAWRTLGRVPRRTQSPARNGTGIWRGNGHPPKRPRIFTPVRFPDEIQAVPGRGGASA